jgi:hypothetical protein
LRERGHGVGRLLGSDVDDVVVEMLGLKGAHLALKVREHPALLEQPVLKAGEQLERRVLYLLEVGVKRRRWLGYGQGCGA